MERIDVKKGQFYVINNGETSTYSPNEFNNWFCCETIGFEDFHKSTFKDVNEIEKAVKCFCENFVLFDESELDTMVLYYFKSIYETKDYDLASCFAKIAFSAARYLVENSRQVYVPLYVVVFIRDTLFEFFIKDRKKYYKVVYAFFLHCIYKIPDITAYGFKDINMLVKGEYSLGYMEADYIEAVYYATLLQKRMTERGLEVPNAALFVELRDLYAKFSEFARLQYGTEPYNQKKVYEVFERSIKKSFDLDVYDAISDTINHPVWLGLAYATAEASNNYMRQYDIARVFVDDSKIADLRSKADDQYKQVIKNKRKKSIRSIVLLLIAVLLAVYGFWSINNNIILYVFSALLVGGALLGYFGQKKDYMIPKSPIWYFGYHYVGPAYWFYDKW